MKTPREFLFQRHQNAEPKLDTIRASAVASLSARRATDSSAATRHRYRWREWVFSLRWHLAGMSAAWVVIILLNLNVGHPENFVSQIPGGKILPARIILASLRENRRELLEMMQASESRDARPPKLFPIQPRSECRDEILTA